VATQPSDGAVAVDAQSRTNVPHIFAIGDVTNRMQVAAVPCRVGLPCRGG
jgi:glutathione reductase (NADPH)